jgi:hypothetical protein
VEGRRTVIWEVPSDIKFSEVEIGSHFMQRDQPGQRPEAPSGHVPKKTWTLLKPCLSQKITRHSLYVYLKEDGQINYNTVTHWKMFSREYKSNRESHSN